MNSLAEKKTTNNKPKGGKAQTKTKEIIRLSTEDKHHEQEEKVLYCWV